MQKKLNVKFFFTYLLIIFLIIFLNLKFLNFVNALEELNSEENSFIEENILKYVDDFISLPKGGTSWNVFGETEMEEYSFDDKDGNEWIGYRPKFSEKIKKLDTKEILVQGYMFPLEQDDKQSLFLLGPFPLSCPYHPHTQSNLLIEVHADKPVLFSYDAINIRGKLELVPKDDEYNMFYRLKNAVLINK